MGLVSQRLEFQDEYYDDNAASEYAPYLDYLANRSSEEFRLPREMEKFFEYVLSLERKLEHLHS